MHLKRLKVHYINWQNISVPFIKSLRYFAYWGGSDRWMKIWANYVMVLCLTWRTAGLRPPAAPDHLQTGPWQQTSSNPVLSLLQWSSTPCPALQLSDVMVAGVVKSLTAGPVSSCPRHQLSGAWYQDLESGVSVSTSSRVRVGGDELSSPHSPSRIVITPTGNESFKINPCLVGNLKHFFILFFPF